MGSSTAKFAAPQLDLDQNQDQDHNENGGSASTSGTIIENSERMEDQDTRASATSDRDQDSTMPRSSTSMCMNMNGDGPNQKSITPSGPASTLPRATQGQEVHAEGSSLNPTRSSVEHVTGSKDQRSQESQDDNPTSSQTMTGTPTELTSEPAPEPSIEIPMNPLRLHLRPHPERGNGVFTSAQIRAGVLIEESPVLVITSQEWEEGRMNDCILGSYGFCWSNGGMGIGLGLASLFNHSPSPNVNFIRNTANNTIKFITSRRVEAGEELCICYSAEESKLWFVPANQNPKSKRRSSSNSNSNSGSKSESESDLEEFPSAMGVGFDAEDLVDEDQMRAKRERQRRLEIARGKANLLKSGGNSNGNRSGKSNSNGQSPTEAKSVSPELQAPRPVRLSSSLSHSAPACASSSTSASASTPNNASIPDSGRSTPSTSSTPVPVYPTASGVTSSLVLPPPLHSQMATGERHAIRRPSQLVEDLDWNEDDWIGKGKEKGEGREGSWGEVVRMKGPAERESEEGANDMMDIWVLEFTDPKLTRTALDFSKDLSNSEERLRHLKRVCRKHEGDREVVRIVLHLVAEYDPSTLSSLASAFSPALSSLTPTIRSVPKHGARTTEQLKRKNHFWPVSFSPAPIIPSTSYDWAVGKKAWVKAGIERVLRLALEAKGRGEVPVATYVTSTPSLFWPSKEEGFIPPTQGLRAASNDTRISENHTLRHATLNCIASIAHLRTVPPFTDVPPTRNGADYLLTSLTMFITHEPCVMCCMALLHSRVKEVFYVFPRIRGGGFGYEPESDSAASTSASSLASASTLAASASTASAAGSATSSTTSAVSSSSSSSSPINETSRPEGNSSGHGYGIHARRDLNHRFEAWKWDEEVDEEIRKALDIDADLQL